MSRTRKNNRQSGTITIRSTKLQTGTGEQLPSFEVHVQVELCGHQVAWDMKLLPGAQVPILLDKGQQVTLIAHEDLLVDSSKAGTLAIVLLEEEPDGEE
jgi:hypothetical protein